MRLRDPSDMGMTTCAGSKVKKQLDTFKLQFKQLKIHPPMYVVISY
jgi:hypothetical protein